MVQTLTSRMGTGGGNVPLVMQPVYCLQGNGIDRADTAGCNGKGWTEDVCYTLNTIDRPAVAYLLNDQGGSSITVESGSHSPTLRAESHGHEPTVCLSFEPGTASLARMYKDPHILCKVTVTPFTSSGFGQYKEGVETLKASGGDLGGGSETLVLESHPQDARIKPLDGVSPSVTAKWAKGAVDTPIVVRKIIRYIVRRLTPTECARLQGFADKWGHPDYKDDLTDEQYQFWLEVRNTHARINGKTVKEYTKEQMLKWYNGLHTDSAEYKMWGNGIALPPALHVMQGIREVLEGA